MPQLIPFHFINQISFTFLILFILITLFSVYIFNQYILSYTMLRSRYQYSSDTFRKEARDPRDRATGTASTARKRTDQPRCATSVLRPALSLRLNLRGASRATVAKSKPTTQSRQPPKHSRYVEDRREADDDRET